MTIPAGGWAITTTGDPLPGLVQGEHTMNTTQNTTTNTTAADDAHKVRTLVEELGDLIDDVSTWGPDDEVRMLPKLHKIRAALSAALDADARPWEPLNGGPLHVGDEVRHDYGGITRIAVVGRVDGDGDPWTAEDHSIGVLDWGTWYVRRTVQELPEWTGAIIEGAGGGRIQATAEGVTYTAAEAIYRDGMWYGAWRTARGGTGIQFSSSSITPGTWQAADQ